MLVDGFFFFTVVEIWRTTLPLGLVLVVLMTEVMNTWHRSAILADLTDGLSSLAFPLSFSLLLISAIVGFVVPTLLKHPIPESHLAVGPWGYEEVCGYVLGVLCLYRIRKMTLARRDPRWVWMGCAAACFIGVGIVWTGRWDAMAHGVNVPEGWFLPEGSSMDWSRVVPKMFHMVFASLAIGGGLLTLLGLAEKSQDNRGIESYVSCTYKQIRYGIGWMLFGVVPQVLIGPWLILALGHTPRENLLSGSGFPSVLFFVSVTIAFLSLVLLNASFMVPQAKGLVWGGLISVSITLMLMGLVRYSVFLWTLHANRIPVALGNITPLHLFTGTIFTGLLSVILFRWCAGTLRFRFTRSYSMERLDKPFPPN